MASYGYEAIDKTGKEVKGSIEAETMEKARTDLKGQGMTVLNLTEQNALTKDINIDFGGKPTARDLGVFCRQFVSMVRAGVTILDALKMLADATENKKALGDTRGLAMPALQFLKLDHHFLKTVSSEDAVCRAWE